MDREIIYPGAVPQEADVLAPQRHAVEALGWLAFTIFGSTTSVEGMTVGPTSPASLAVQVAPGAIYAPLALDANAFSTLEADPRVVMQQGLLRDTAPLTLTPPTISGQSRVYVIQATCQVVDTDPGVLPYYNPADPNTALTGPGGAGTPQNTRRAAQAVVSLKAGVAASTGTETAPTPDAGYVELARVTLANGATSIPAANIVANASLRRKIGSLPDLRDILVGSRQQVFGTAGTFSWTVPENVYRIRGRVWGGGGGGGAAAASSGNSAAGSAGGGGGYTSGVVSVFPGQVLTITVAPGGTSGIVSGTTPTNGGAGGSSSVGSFLTSTGGAGGASAYNSIAGAGGAGGESFGGSEAQSGTIGSVPLLFGATYAGGPGGGTFGTSNSYVGGVGATGPGGIGPGGGGSGAAASNGAGGSGGPGAAGRVILEY